MRKQIPCRRGPLQAAAQGSGYKVNLEGTDPFKGTPFLSYRLLAKLSLYSFSLLCNKLPQTQWLKVTEVHSPFWRPEVQSQSVSRAILPLKAPRKNFSLPLPAFGGSRQSLDFLNLQLHHSNPYFHLHTTCISTSLCIFLCPLLFLGGRQSLGLGSTLIKYDHVLSLISITSVMTLFPNRVIVLVLFGCYNKVP